MIAPTAPDCPVGCSKQGFDLVAAQIMDQSLVATLHWDRHNLRYLPQTVWDTQRYHAEERADGGEPVVA